MSRSGVCVECGKTYESKKVQPPVSRLPSCTFVHENSINRPGANDFVRTRRALGFGRRNIDCCHRRGAIIGEGSQMKGGDEIRESCVTLLEEVYPILACCCDGLTRGNLSSNKVSRGLCMGKGCVETDREVYNP